MFEPGDIVQIIDQEDTWYPCLLIVTEPKSWGMQGCALIPNSNDGSVPVGQAYRRIKFEKLKRVGRAEIIPA